MLWHRHIVDRINMHLHDNPTDTQHHGANTYDVSLGRATTKEPLDAVRSTLGYQAEKRPYTTDSMTIELARSETVNANVWMRSTPGSRHPSGTKTMNFDSIGAFCSLNRYLSLPGIMHAFPRCMATVMLLAVYLPKREI